MIDSISKFSFFIILLMPISLISGPAIPDISITLIGLFFLNMLFFQKKNYEILKIRWVQLSFIFWFFLIFISLFAENKYLAYKEAFIFLRILFIPIFIYYWILTDQSKIKLALFVIIISVLFVCVDSIYQFSNYHSPTGFGRDLFGYIPDFYGRLTGPFKDLVPGAFISKFSLFGLVYIFLSIKEKKFQTIISVLYLSLVGFVTYISGERMALATFLLALSFLFIFIHNKRLIFLLSLFVIFISIFIINKTHPIYNDYKVISSTPYHLGLKVEKSYECEKQNETCKKIILLQPSFKEVISNFNQSAYGQIYSLGIKMWEDHKFHGVGLNNFTYLCNEDLRYKNLIKNYNCVTHPHNIYLQWLVETGVFGLLIFCLYIFLIFYFIYKKKSYPYNIIAFSILIILFWPIMSTGSLLKNWMGVSSFYIIGLSLVITQLKQRI